MDHHRLVKTRKFTSPKYVGDPMNAIKIFNKKEVDELILLDISASKSKQSPDFEYIGQLASECFMPLTYGGGINSIAHAETLFSLGVEKVCLQTSVISDFQLVKELSKRFGAQAVIVSVDLKKNILGKLKPYSHAGKKISSEWLPLLQEAEASGAGEIFINSVDNDGEMNGMDIGLIREAATKLSVPLIAAGGVGSLEDIKAAADAGASAIAVGSFFVFQGPHRAVLITYPEYKKLENLLRS